MTVNAVDVRKVQRGAIEILPQFDVFMDSITVWEHLVFMVSVNQFGSFRPSRWLLNSSVVSGSVESSLKVTTCRDRCILLN